MINKAPYAKCNDCTLKDGIFVPSETHNSKILIVVEAPGYHESVEGKPLVGVAGQDMNMIIESVGATRENFATLVNSVSCRPTKIEEGKEHNRTPTEEEIKCCNDRLAYEIEKYNPSIIIAMGRVPYTALGGTIYSGFKMGDVIGTEFTYKGKYKVIVTYHPAAITHSGGVTTDRGKAIMDNIKNVFEYALKIKNVDVQQPKQLRLF